MIATSTQLLSSGEFCKLRYGTIPVKSASANVSFCTNNSKNCRILSCDTLVANERYSFITVTWKNYVRNDITNHTTSLSRIALR